MTEPEIRAALVERMETLGIGVDDLSKIVNMPPGRVTSLIEQTGYALEELITLLEGVDLELVVRPS
jgi:hypothetical protein